MWGEKLLARTARQVFGKTFDRAMYEGLARLADTVRSAGGQPLDIVLPDTSRVSFGGSPKVILAIRDPAVLPLLSSPTLNALGSAFVEGQIDIEGDMLEAIRIADALTTTVGASATMRDSAAPTGHTPRQDRVDIRHHYDVGNDFYRLWLDERMVYSCAYFERGDETIDRAQLAKLDHVCRKLRLTPGERLLDIGCGWGGLVLHAARHYGVRAVGVTLSDSQYRLARERIAEAGLQDQAEVLLLDYREVPARFGLGSFDKLASVGMFEHVGLRNLGAYFDVARQVLRERGLMMNHGITSSDVGNRPVGSGGGAFIQKYVFPHGELPHLHVAIREMATHDFEIVDVESLRVHYALTCQHWSRRLDANLGRARHTASEQIVRVWRVYLAGCSYGFSRGWMNLHQVLGVRRSEAGPTGLPLTRRWIYE